MAGQDAARERSRSPRGGKAAAKASKRHPLKRKKRRGAAARALPEKVVVEDGVALLRALPGLATGQGREDQAQLTLLEQANDCMAQLPPQPERARELLEEAHAAEPDSTEIMDSLGSLLCQLGDHAAACHILRRSVELQPKANAEKYLHLAMMSSGEEAAALYQEGAAILRSELKDLPSRSSSSSDQAGAADAVQGAPLRKQLAGVQASIAELYMTDLCDSPDAEKNCEEAVRAGLEVDATSVELLTTKTMLLKVQGNLCEAKECALLAAKQVKATDEAVDAAEPEDEVAPVDEDAVASLCRAMIDLEMSAEARELLVGLLERDEEDLRAWVLLGWCHVVEKDPEVAKDCATHGLRLCKKNGAQTDDWKPELRKLLKKAQGMPPKPKVEEEDEEADADDGEEDQ